MAVPNILIVTLAAAGFVGAWLAVLFWIPSNLCSLFRYRLWKVRDDMVDDLLAERLPDTPVVRNEIKSVEEMIAISEHVTAYRFAAAAVTPWSAQDEAKACEEFDAIDSLSEEHQRRLWKYRNAAYRATTFHVLAGSPSGWLLATLIVPLALLIAVRKGARSVRGVLAEWGDACVRIVRMFIDDGPHNFGGGAPASQRPLTCLV